jgi:predicted porin
MSLLSTFSIVSYAQSNVAIYGIVDTAVDSIGNVPVGQGAAHQTALAPGMLFGSRIGFKGNEDLGNGLSALFVLENGFSPTAGTLGQQGQFFGRQAFVGLKDTDLGEIDLGRQYGVAATWDFAYDPIGVGDGNENSWQYYIYGYRFDNTVKYTKKWGSFTAALQYSVGGQAGSTTIGATEGASLNYADGPLSVGGFYQKSDDANNKEQKSVGLGGSYLVNQVTGYLNYFSSTRDPGFAKAANLSGGALANTSMLSNADNTLQRKDNVLTTGLVFNRAHEKGWTYTLAYMQDSVTNDLSANKLSDADGKVAIAYGIAEYNFSKKTEVYLELDHTMLSGNEINGAHTVMSSAGSSFGGNTTRNGIAIGLVMKF